jgi:hypothetical protein
LVINEETKEVKGGTVTKLVEILTHETHLGNILIQTFKRSSFEKKNINVIDTIILFFSLLDPDYLQAFLLTYRSFTSPSDFLSKLQQRYPIQIHPSFFFNFIIHIILNDFFTFMVQAPAHIDEDDLKRFQDTMQRPIRLRFHLLFLFFLVIFRSNETFN